MLKVKDKYDYRKELCEVLRSNKYRQGRGQLHNETLGDTYCALGVFAVAVLGLKLHYSRGVSHLIESNGQIQTDSISLLKRLGIYKQYDIITANDSGKSFEKIAIDLENLP